MIHLKKSIRLFALAILFSIGPIHATPVVLDDSMSVVKSGPLKITWDQDKLGFAVPNIVRSQSHIGLLLMVEAFAGKNVRITQTLNSGTVPWNVSWKASGHFYEGSAKSGQRVTVFEGLIPKNQRFLESDFLFKFWMDGSSMSHFSPMAFIYDLEVVN